MYKLLEGGVLIESDWNLKLTCGLCRRIACKLVLIESDWNLKEYRSMNQIPHEFSINRIRLEFKVDSVKSARASPVAY